MNTARLRVGPPCTRDQRHAAFVNAGVKMHRRAGAKMHQGQRPEGRRGGLLASRSDGALPGVSFCTTMRGVVALWAGMVSPCQTLAVGQWSERRSGRSRRLPAAHRRGRRLAGCPATPPARRHTAPAILSVPQQPAPAKAGGVVPAPGPAAMIGRAARAHDRRASRGRGTMAGLAFRVSHGPLTDRFAWHGSHSEA